MGHLLIHLNLRILQKSWSFFHQTSSSRVSQSNAQVERTIETVKSMSKKCNLDKTDTYLFSLLELMNTPISWKIPSPAQILKISFTYK